jgi:hypothetical protein
MVSRLALYSAFLRRGTCVVELLCPEANVKENCVGYL